MTPLVAKAAADRAPARRNAVSAARLSCARPFVGDQVSLTNSRIAWPSGKVIECVGDGLHLTLAQAFRELRFLFSEKLANDLAPCRVPCLLKKLGQVLYVFAMNEEPYHLNTCISRHDARMLSNLRVQEQSDNSATRMTDVILVSMPNMCDFCRLSRVEVISCAMDS